MSSKGSSVQGSPEKKKMKTTTTASASSTSSSSSSPTKHSVEKSEAGSNSNNSSVRSTVRRGSEGSQQLLSLFSGSPKRSDANNLSNTNNSNPQDSPSLTTVNTPQQSNNNTTTTTTAANNMSSDGESPYTSEDNLNNFLSELPYASSDPDPFPEDEVIAKKKEERQNRKIQLVSDKIIPQILGNLKQDDVYKEPVTVTMEYYLHTYRGIAPSCTKYENISFPFDARSGSKYWVDWVRRNMRRANKAALRNGQPEEGKVIKCYGFECGKSARKIVSSFLVMDAYANRDQKGGGVQMWYIVSVPVCKSKKCKDEGKGFVRMVYSRMTKEWDRPARYVKWEKDVIGRKD